AQLGDLGRLRAEPLGGRQRLLRTLTIGLRDRRARALQLQGKLSLGPADLVDLAAHLGNLAGARKDGLGLVERRLGFVEVAVVGQPARIAQQPGYAIGVGRAWYVGVQADVARLGGARLGGARLGGARLGGARLGGDWRRTGRRYAPGVEGRRRRRTVSA